jgi:hypothetical protein
MGFATSPSLLQLMGFACSSSLLQLPLLLRGREQFCHNVGR